MNGLCTEKKAKKQHTTAHAHTYKRRDILAQGAKDIENGKMKI